jgi:predicted nucleic acid-binding protein
VALLDRSEAHHQICAAAVSDASFSLVTCEPVIAEACYLLRKLRGAADAILDNVGRGVFNVPFRIDQSTQPLRALMKKYTQGPMDLADACLVHLATELGTGRILTLDGDFRIYRWGKNRPFELLIDLC